MDFLRLLEAGRTPFFDKVFSVVTYLGDQTVFMLAVMFTLWCVNKRWGYRLFYIGMVGNIMNQLLKAIFIIPRPWVLDENFTIVESARGAATGYSFPSGHTQGVTTLFGGVAAWLKKGWVNMLSAGLILLTGFSRMYLGVHTPADVLTSLGTGVITVVVLALLFRRFENSRRATLGFGAFGLLFALSALLYVLLAPKTAANVAEFDEAGVKACFTMLGTMLGLCLAWVVDDRWIKYDTRAVWWAQILKFVIGIGLVVAVRLLLKTPLNALFAGAMIADGVRYFLMTVMGGILWPLTFRFWAKLGKKTGESAEA